MFSIIVVGTDGSETAGAAVALAAQLARENHSKLHLVVGVRPPRGVAVPVGGIQAGDPSGAALMRSTAERMLSDRADEIKELDVELHAGVGDPADTIVRVADEVRADLIVVGSKGMRGTRRILGSVPNSVAHKASCHVLVAKTT